MVANMTDIYKANNHLSSENIDPKKITTCDIGNPCTDLRQAHKCGGVKSCNVIISPSLDNWISNDNTALSKQ